MDHVLLSLLDTEKTSDLPDGDLKDELRAMPGSLLLKVYEAWLKFKPEPLTGGASMSKAPRRSVRYFKELLANKSIAALNDKLRGYTGMVERDARLFLTTLLTHWQYDLKNQKTIAFNQGDSLFIKKFVDRLMALLYEKDTKLMLVKFDGVDAYRYCREFPNKFGMSFVSSQNSPFLISDSKEMLSRVSWQLENYLLPDPKHTKGVHAWVIDTTCTKNDMEAYTRFSHLCEIHNVIASLRFIKPSAQHETDIGLPLYRKRESEEAHFKQVDQALKNRLLIFARGLPQYVVHHLKQLYAETDGEREPDSPEFDSLLEEYKHLSFSHFVQPSPFNLWPYDKGFKPFIPVDFDGDVHELQEKFNLVSFTTVKPTDPSHTMQALDIEYRCVGYPFVKGEREESTHNNSAHNNDATTSMAMSKRIMTKMPSPSAEHDQAYTLMYIAASHRLRRSLFEAGDERERLPIMKGQHSIWALRRYGIEVIPAYQLLKSLSLER